MTTRLTNRTERLVYMEQLLFRNASGMRAVELAEACGVDRRTVYRDLSLLTDVGLPIYQKDGRFCLLREQYLATIRLSLDETVALLMSASVSRQENPHLISAMAKISHALPDALETHANLLIEMRQHSGDAAEAKILDTITRAWAEQRCIQMVYRSRDDGKTKLRVVSVYFIEPKRDGSVYIVGYDSLSERVRAFRLSRIEQVTMLQSTYEMPFQFDTKRYLFSLRGASKKRGRHPEDHPL